MIATHNARSIVTVEYYEWPKGTVVSAFQNKPDV